MNNNTNKDLFFDAAQMAVKKAGWSPRDDLEILRTNRGPETVRYGYRINKVLLVHSEDLYKQVASALELVKTTDLSNPNDAFRNVVASRIYSQIGSWKICPYSICDYHDILDACASGINKVEREGVSVTHPARFVLIGTMNPEEGNLRPQILDRFALSVEISTETDPLRRIEIIERNLAWDADPESFYKAFSGSDERLRKTIGKAKERLRNVKLPMSAIETVASTMARLELDGQRPDLVTIRAARAWASSLSISFSVAEGKATSHFTCQGRFPS